MADTWAISGRDLHLDLGRSGRRAALERALREAVQSGRLAPGTLLPPSRALASDLGIARNTVAEAYTQLVAEGWLTARQGSGTRVAGAVCRPVSPLPPLARPARRPPGRSSAAPPTTCARASRTSRRSRRRVARRGPDGAGPRPVVGLRLRHPAGRAGAARGARGLPRAHPRRAGHPERVVVCAGFGQGLWALAAALRGLGPRRVGVESHGLPLHRRVLAGARAGLVAAAGGCRGGAAPRSWTGARRGCDAVLLTPAHQFPLGTALDAAHRAAFVRWARAAAPCWSRTTTTASSATTGSRSARCRRWPPTTSSTAARRARRWPPRLRLAWLVLPEHLVDPVSTPS